MKKRIAVYVRVSTASKAQLHSYEFQEQYWHEKFTDDPANELVGIYADKGISGSSMYKRPQFLIMMQDAREGKFDVIYTKSVSRFARNTVQLLKAVRELRDIGIEVVFEKEGIHSLQPTSEVFMTIAASIAENDLMVDSERQRWSIRHRCENGWISIGSGMYGYTMTKENTLEIVPEEATVVKRIFDMYIGGLGCTRIARALNADGITTWKGNHWSPNRILEIISNEKYMGDTIMGKSVYVLGVEYDNSNGDYGTRYYMEDTHEGIVSKDTFRTAQDIRAARANAKLVGKKHTVHPFTGLIECGQCHKHYLHKVNNSGKKWQTDIWQCGTMLKHGKNACDCGNIKDSVLREKFVEAYNEFVIRRPEGETITTLKSILEDLQKEESELALLYMQRLIPESAFRTEQQRIKDRIRAANDMIVARRGKRVRETDLVTITEFKAAKVEKFIRKVIIQKGTVTFLFYNGVAISREFTNGQAGNKVGWNRKEA